MEAVKSVIATAYVLTVWCLQRDTRVTTDASDVGMGAIIEQRYDDEQWKIVSS